MLNDYIRRSDVLKLFDEWGGGFKYIEVETEGAISAMEQLPSIDAVPIEKYEALKGSAKVLSDICFEKEYVVRCRDCKYYSPFKNGQGQCDRQICCVTFPDDYCSYGERGEAE